MSGFAALNLTYVNWAAMQSVFTQGYSTPDLSRPGSGAKMIGTEEFGDRVVDELRKQTD